MQIQSLAVPEVGIVCQQWHENHRVQSSFLVHALAAVVDV